MVTPADLCFEYMPRWTEILPILLDPSRRDEAMAMLEEKDRQLEDFIAANVCGSDGGCCPEYFALRTDTGSPLTVSSGGGTGAIKFRTPLSSTARSEHYTSGVTPGTTGIDVPAGLWWHHININLEPSTTTDPTSGHVYIYGPYSDAWGFMPFTDLTVDTEDEATLQFTEQILFSSADTITYTLVNNTDQDVIVRYGRAHGHQVCNCATAG